MAQVRPSNWQEKLREHCRAAHMRPPVWSEVSDRRGGRTAWSSVVAVEGQSIPARYWYDGQYIENAREDAAEVALQRLGVTNAPPSPHQRLYGTVSSP